MNSALPPALARLSTLELTALVADVGARERVCVLDFLHLLIELERRKTYAELGFDSLFTYCTQSLHLSEGYTFRRTTAAKLLSRFPAIAPFLADGRINLSNLVLLKDTLTTENHLDVLQRASHQSQLEVKKLVAALAPRPDLGSSIRRLPRPSPQTLAPPPASSTLATLESNPRPVASPPPAAPTVAFTAPPPGSEPLPSAPSRRARVEPLSPGRYALKLTVSEDFKAKLEKAQSALGHVVPDGNFESVLHECLDLALSVLARQNRIAPLSARAAMTSSLPADDSPGVASLDGLDCVAPITFAAKVDPLDCSHASVGHDPHAFAAKVDPLDRSHASVGHDPHAFAAKVDSLECCLSDSAADDELFEFDDSGYIPASVKRAVRIRDEDCCSFVGSTGSRCRSTRLLQFHHRIPVARGGPSSLSNVTLHCSAHNHYRAIVDFGFEHMAAFSRGDS